MADTSRLRRLLEHRWLLVLFAVAIALSSSFWLWVTLQNDYWNYWLYPELKAADPGFYIYPQLRYTLFDIVLLAWCSDGLVASGLSIRSAFSSRSISGWTYRAIVLYFVLLIVLILGGSLMQYVRGRGF
jgi:hypothetical protein